jgi:ABC-type lipoprotein release transport system permease subunit
MTAMGVATALIVLTLAVYEGMFRDMILSATAYQGQIRITAEGYFEDREMDQTIPQDATRQTILSYPGAQGAAGRVRGFALLSYGEGDSSRAQASELLGIDPGEERDVSEFSRRVIAGNFLSGGNTKEIVLGRGLARSLEAEIGGEIVAMGQDVYGSVAADIFRVTGIVDTGDPVRDVSLALTGRETLQTMLALPGQLHEWAVRLESPLQANAAAAGLRTELPGYDVRPWTRFLPQLNEILRISDVSRFIFALIFYFAVILVTVNTMYMALFERMREFAVMSAIGLRPARLSLMIVLEALLMSSIAGVIGGIFGFLAGLYLQTHPVDISSIMPTVTFAETTLQPRIYAVPAPNVVITPIVMVIVLGSIVALFPAWRLKRLRPVEVLREV